MRCTSKNHINVRRTKKRAITLAFLICFIVVSLLLESFILTHADHRHDHDGVGGACTTCTQIQNAENLLKQLGAVTLAAISVIGGLFSIAVITWAVQSFITNLTPIKLKIRMNH